MGIVRWNWLGGIVTAAIFASLGGIQHTFASTTPDALNSGAVVSGASSAGVASQHSPAEIASRLEAQGIPPEKIQEMLTQMPGAAAGALPQGDLTDPASTGELSPKIPADRVMTAPGTSIDSTMVAAAAEDEPPLPFGYDLFKTSPDTYHQPASGPVDPNYILGPGDQIVLDVWGDTVFRLERDLDREGGVNLPDVGRIVLAGLKLEEARHTLRRRLSAVYSGLSENDSRATTHLSVTLGNLRVIRAFVVGRAQRPGGYDLSAASTVFHALFFGGGPTLNGSMRDIRLVRNGKEIAKLDVYEYLRSGKRQGDVRLENDDTIFIPPVGSRVTILGQVREAGLYELLPGETLGDLVDLAGGLTERALTGRIQVERILPFELQKAEQEDRRFFDFAYDAAGKSTSLHDGDVITVFEIADRIRNFVTFKGEVRHPGTYELRAGATLSEVLEEAGGLLDTAYLERAEIVRTHEDKRREQIAVDLRKLTGPASIEERNLVNVQLLPRDEVIIHSQWTFRDPEHVSIYGAVRSPGSFELLENMTLHDLLLQAGGLQEYAFRDEIEISRVSPGTNRAERSAEVIRVPLGSDGIQGTEADFALQPFDNVFVREQPYYELQRNVVITGEVRFPGVYTLTNPRERLSAMIQRAGGLKETAFPDGFTLTREKNKIGRVALNLRKALEDPSSNDNIVLFAGDSLFVPEEPKTVAVTGEVGYPTSLVHVPGWSVGDYVSRAGGADEDADRGQTRVIYSTGAAARVRKLWFDPEVRPGSTIVVPKKPEGEGVNWGNVVRDTTSILASLATVLLVVDKAGS